VSSNPTQVCKFNNAIYDLKQALRHGFKKLILLSTILVFQQPRVTLLFLQNLQMILLFLYLYIDHIIMDPHMLL